MNNFSVRRINFVGAGAALLAFIFSFIPFYGTKISDAFYSVLGSSMPAMGITKNLVTYNFFGALCMILSLAALVLYVLNLNDIISLAAIGASALNFVSLMLAIIVGNGDIKSVKSSLNLFKASIGFDMKEFIKIGPKAGLFLEIIFVLIMVASYWINELVIKPYVMKDTTPARINPLEGVITQTGSFAGQPGQFAGQPQQFAGQPQQFAQQPGQFAGQPQQFAGQSGQSQQFAGQPQQSGQFTQQSQQPQQPGQQQ